MLLTIDCEDTTFILFCKIIFHHVADSSYLCSRIKTASLMKWIRKVLKGLSLTAAMFVFQACYGTGEDYLPYHMVFHVMDEATGEPIRGIAIRDLEYNVISYTNGDGMANVWGDSTMIRYSFVDNDSVYIPKDTIVNPALHDTVEILLEKAL